MIKKITFLSDVDIVGGGRDSHSDFAILDSSKTCGRRPAGCCGYINSWIFPEELVQFLVEVFLIFDRLDKAVTDLDKAIVFDDEAADRTCSECLTYRLTTS